MSLLQLVYLLPLIGLWVFAGFDEALTMIAIATTLFLAIKTHSLLIYQQRCRKDEQRQEQDAQFDFKSCLGWYTVWWGLKPSEFFKRHPAEPIERGELAFAGLKCAVGVLLLTVIVPGVLNHLSESVGRDIIGGWLGMVGIVFCMHFGYSHITAVVLRARGRLVTPIMNRPVVASSVSEFWGKRWNLAFRDYAHVTLFMPLARKWGAAIGAIAGFVFSGVIHELAISLPARGGYGWPMLYFLIQGLGVLGEREFTKWGWWKPGSVVSRCWAIVVVALPVPMLFHQAFVTKVIVPIVGWCDLSWLLS